MKLSMLPGVLFDEFPNNDTIKYCFFTQPKSPEVDCSEYMGKVLFYCNPVSKDVMSRHKNLPIKLFSAVRDSKKLTFNTQIEFGVRFVPTGNVSGSSMLLIYIEEDIHLYTGQFTEFRTALLYPYACALRNRITDIHLDNTSANSIETMILERACDDIIEIVKNHNGFTVYLHTEMFGYEDLIYKLAQMGMKIKLNKLQEYQFKRCNNFNWFEFDEAPQIKICSPMGALKAFTQREYEMMFTGKIIHIYLLFKNNSVKSEIKGLFYVNYTPHPTSFTLCNLIQLFQPKRVHPLLSRTFNDDFYTVIPKYILNDDCEIVDYDKTETNRTNESDAVITNDDEGNGCSFFEISQPLEEFTGEISEIISEPEDSENSQEDLSVGKSIKASTERQEDSNIVLLDEDVIMISDDSSIDSF